MNQKRRGKAWEEAAALFLEEQGFCILERNFRCRRAEIDLVAREGRYLVFVEVKGRSSPFAGYGAEAVDFRKQQRILQAARYYLLQRALPGDTPVRFDVVSVDAGQIRLIRNAFLCPGQ